MKNNTDWIHPDNNLGEMFVDITERDAEDFLYDEGHKVRWCFPVFDKKGNILGNVNIELGQSVKEPHQKKQVWVMEEE